jgi:hypothetical protein
MSPPSHRIRFDRHEWAGAFGDAGTDIPLLVGMMIAADLDGTSMLVMFGVFQILSGLTYRIPMPVQPLKAMAAIVIAQGVSAPVLFGGGLAVGVVMLVLTVTGLLEWLGRVVPKSVIRGVQLGLGLQLASIALQRYVPAEGNAGYALAGVSFLIIIVFLGHEHVPAALPVLALGIAWAVVFRLDGAALARSAGFGVPVFRTPSLAEIGTGFLLLAIPQIPLSLGNSVLATRQLAEDLFPERGVTLKKIGFTYSLMNLVAPWFGGVPACHGSGGMAGHFTFGGRTGGSVVIYGALLVTAGLSFGSGFDQFVAVFPLPILGVLLLFESLALIWLIRDVAVSRSQFSITILVGLVAVGLPYGYLIGLVLGTLLAVAGDRVRLVSPDAPSND